jgi:hypothetical protein
MSTCRLRRLLGLILALSLGSWSQPSMAAGQKYFAYNNTVRTDFKGVYLAPAGTQDWGPNQALNDKDKSLEAAERLPLKGVSPGRYDVRLVTADGRTCVLRNVDLTRDNSFEVRDAQLAECR